MAASEILLPVRDYDLAATLDSGQVFRWRQIEKSWHGVVGRHFVQLTQTDNGIRAQTTAPMADWDFLRHFLQTEVDLAAVLKTFPDDEPMRAAVAHSRGLRLLRQDPWECLASFILSSTKQIVQIRQIVALLCERFGERLAPQPMNSSSRHYSFPAPEKIAAASEAELRACKMGFRAPYLLNAARVIAEGELNLINLQKLSVADARAELIKLKGVGVKIADCVLLFAYGFQEAFPMDVWVIKALRELYFPRRRPKLAHLKNFTNTYFGPNAGYAQQYLFHYMRTQRG